MAFDLSQTLTASQNIVGAATSAVNIGSNLASALSGPFNSPGDVASAIRSIDLPSAGEAVGDILSAVASFGGDANSNDWRVRLSLANWTSFKSSPVLKPLKDAGGLIFPYTPEGKMQEAKEHKEIKKLKIRAEELRRMSYQYKRNFGKEEREQRSLYS